MIRPARRRQSSITQPDSRRSSRRVGRRRSKTGVWWDDCGMDEPTSTDVAHAAVDALLQVVAQSARDLQTFHDVIARARLSPLPPFPRATVILSERIIDRLAKVDGELEEVLIGLG